MCVYVRGCVGAWVRGCVRVCVCVCVCLKLAYVILKWNKT